MIRALHIIAIAFALIMLVLSIRSYLRHKLKLIGLLGWGTVWVGAIIATLLFDHLAAYTQQLNVRVFDFLVVLAFLVIFAVLYRLHAKLEQLGGKMEQIVEEIAMRDFQAAEAGYTSKEKSLKAKSGETDG